MNQAPEHFGISIRQVNSLLFFVVKGRTGVYGEKARIVKPGDVVICPAGVKHFHGAAPDSQMVQMTVTGDHREGKGVTWLEEVTDEQYNNLEK